MSAQSTNQLETWEGQFGDAYVDRNSADPSRTRASTAMWAKILDRMAGDPPASILEVGANVGANVRALNQLTDAAIHALEPNDKARGILQSSRIIPDDRIYKGAGQAIPLADGAVDMAFTCGVLIHVPPSDLLKVCAEIFRCARKYVVCIEYFAVEPEEKEYRGQSGLLFKRDFGSFWLDNFPSLTTVDVGFNWKRTTSLDNTTWWVFRKT